MDKFWPEDLSIVFIPFEGLKPLRNAVAERTLRVALFTDSFHETNGVATLSRAYVEYARRQNIPFFCAYGGDRESFAVAGSTQKLCLRRGWLSFPFDAEMKCDLALVRHRAVVLRRLRAFQPDLIHITGPGDVSVLGFWVSNTLTVPLVASWHTNLHEYAERRLRGIPGNGAALAKAWSFRALMKYYRLAHFVTSPNEEMRQMLESETARPSFVMAHGVDTKCFSPRWRRPGDGRFCVGYVGRLTPEKNVRALVEIERELEQEGNQDFRILVVGAGSEEEWLRTNLRRAEFSGTLHGDALAAAFAEMDTMVFPSHTDTFGLVVLEAMASGVPVILTEAAGRRVGVVDGESGILTTNFAEGVRRVMQTPGLRERMGETAREHARERGWGRVFENLQAIYRSGLASGEVRARIRRAEERLAVG